jgi:hypothetical protein
MYSAAGADYLEMIIIFGECKRNARETARVFEERFPGRNNNYFFVCNTFFFLLQYVVIIIEMT